MIQDLADKIWSNVRFHRAAKSIERAWLAAELKLSQPAKISEAIAVRAMSASAVLACSVSLEHRMAALRLSTHVYEIFQASQLSFDAALRVVLTRLGNFPAVGTRASVEQALEILPWSLATEEIIESSSHSVRIGDRVEVLTNFQNGFMARFGIEKFCSLFRSYIGRKVICSGALSRFALRFA